MSVFRSSPFRFYVAVLFLLSFLSLALSSTVNPLFKQWKVRRYDLELKKLLRVEINGIEVSGEKKFQNEFQYEAFHISRYHISLQVLDTSHIHVLELNGILLPLNDGKIEIDIFPPKSRPEDEIIKLVVNQQFKLIIANIGGANYEAYSDMIDSLYYTQIGTRTGVGIISNVLSADPYCARAYEKLLQTLDNSRDEIRSVCRSQLARLLERGDGLNPLALYTLAEINRRSKKLDVAKMQYQKILEASPFFAPAYLGLSQISEAKNDLDTCILYFGKANRTQNSGGKKLISEMLASMKNRLEKKFHRADSNDRKTAIQRANLEFASIGLIQPSSDLELVIKKYKELASDGSTDISNFYLLLNLAQSFYMEIQGLKNKTEADMERVRAEIQGLKNDAKAEMEKLLSLMARSGSISQNSEFNRAVFTLLMAIAAFPGDEENEEQYQYARWWLAHHPDNDLPLHIREVLQTLKKSKDEDAYNELLLAQALMDLNPDDPRYLNNLAVVLASNGFIMTATRALRQALTLSPVWNGVIHNKKQVYRSIYENLRDCYDLLGPQETGSLKLTYEILSQEAEEMASKF